MTEAVSEERFGVFTLTSSRLRASVRTGVKGLTPRVLGSQLLALNGHCLSAMCSEASLSFSILRLLQPSSESLSTSD